MSEIIKINKGDIIEYDSPETTSELFHAKVEGTKALKHMLVLDASEDFDVKYMYENHLIKDDCNFLAGVDQNGHIVNITIGEWVHEDFRIVGHKDLTTIQKTIFGDWL